MKRGPPGGLVGSARGIASAAVLLLACSNPPVLPLSNATPSATPSEATPTPTRTPKRDPRCRFQDAAKLKPAFAWGPSGALFVVAGDTLETFDAEGRRVAEERFPIAGPIEGLQISRDGGTALVLTASEWMAVSTSDWGVRVRGPRGDASCLLMSPDGSRFAARQSDDGLTVVDLADAKARAVGHGCPVGWSGDGRWLVVTLDSDGADPPRSTVGLWKDGDAQVAPFLADTNISTAALSDDGARVLVARRDREAVRVYAREAGGAAPPLATHEFDLPRIAHIRARVGNTFWNSLGGDAVVFAGGVVRRPDAGRGLEGLVFDAGWRWEDRRVDVEAIALQTSASAPRWVASRCGTEAPFVGARWVPRVCVWRLANGERVRLRSRAVEATTALVGIARDEAGTVLAAKGADGSVRVWDTQAGTLGSLLGIAAPEPRGPFDSVFARDLAHVRIACGLGRVVVSADGGPVRVWEADASAWRSIDRPDGVFDIDPRWIVHVREGKVIVNAMAGSAGGLFDAPADVAGMALAPMEDAVALWTATGAVEVRALPNGRGEAFAPAELGAAPMRVAFSPDGRFLDVTTKGDLLLLDRTTRAASPTSCAGGPTFASRAGFVDVLRVNAFSCSGWAQQPSTCEKTVLHRRRADGSCDGEAVQVVHRAGDAEGWWIGREADVDDPQWLRTRAPKWSAEVSLDGEITLTLADGEKLYLRALRGLDAGFVYTEDGAFDVLGHDAEAAMSSVFCTVDSGLEEAARPASGEACAGARVPGLLRDALERGGRPGR